MARIAGGVSRAQLFTLLLIHSVIVVSQGALGGSDTPPDAFESPPPLPISDNKLTAAAHSSSLSTQLLSENNTKVSSSLFLLSDQPQKQSTTINSSTTSNKKQQLISLSSISSLSSSSVTISPPYEFHFLHIAYNVSIPENSVGKTYAIQPPNEDRMGIYITPDLDVKYRIMGGDKDKIFKAEERIVGDFAFLAIRTRTGNVVLNREKDDHYKLEVRATATKREGKSKVVYEADTIVYVRVQDTNDLSPLFYPTEYSVTIPEDTPLHKSILRVIAEDADLGINGEIYYSLLDETEQFSVHPTSGVITLTRPLKFMERSVHELTVVANDRGRSSTTVNRINQASKAKVKIKVKQVSEL